MRCSGPTRPFALALAGLMFTSGAALANGRRPTAVDVHFHPTDNSIIYLATTFGLMVSRDDGATFRWVCEQAACPVDDPQFNACDTYDPQYAITSDGTIYNTTIDGLRVSRDNACSFQTFGPPLDRTFLADVVADADDNIWVVSTNGAAKNDVYKSVDDGQTFVPLGMTVQPGWWETIRVAPTDTQRVYLTGWVPGAANGDGGFDPATTLLYRSDNGGTSWIPLPVTDFDPGARLLLEEVSPTNRDLVFARVRDFDVGHIYRSEDGGVSWAKVITLPNTSENLTDPPGIVRFAARTDGQTYLVGSPMGGLHISTDFGKTFTPAQVSPLTWCIRERGDGTLFACSENWDPNQVLDPSVRSALLRSATGQTWQGVFRFADTVEAYQCPDDTVQHLVCDLQRWCGLADTFGIDACDAGGTGGDDTPAVDAAITAPPGNDDCGGCGGCSIGFATALFSLPRLRRKRRRRRARHR